MLPIPMSPMNTEVIACGTASGLVENSNHKYSTLECPGGSDQEGSRSKEEVHGIQSSKIIPSSTCSKNHVIARLTPSLHP